jgi:cytochrome c oxidase cbb3-type subunit 1
VSVAESSTPYPESDLWAVRYLYCALAWLVVLMLAGLVASLQFFWPQMFFGIPELSFGRFRPVHSQGILYGWLSLAMMGSWLFILPRLTRSPVQRVGLGGASLVVWNVATAAGAVLLMLGYTQGYEYADWLWPVDILFALALGMFLYMVLASIARRRERGMYVSLWYMVGTLVWFTGVYLIGNTPIWSGTNQMNINWFLGHSLVGLWFTTGIVSIAYYLFPKVFGQPIFSHKLSLIGFWSIGALYIQNGPHHLLFGNMFYWLQTYAVVTSVLLLIPVWVVLTNWWGTMRGRWQVIGDNVVAKFLVAGWFFYLFTCLQGPLQATRSLSAYVHFTHWTVGHAHLALLGFATAFLTAAAYYVIPSVAGRPLFSRALANWHFWIYVAGTLGMVVDLTIAGLVQAADWRQGLPFIYSVLELHTYWILRSVSGAALIVSEVLFVYNLWRTVRPAAVRTALGRAVRQAS